MEKFCGDSSSFFKLINQISPLKNSQVAVSLVHCKSLACLWHQTKRVVSGVWNCVAESNAVCIKLVVKEQAIELFLWIPAKRGGLDVGVKLGLGSTASGSGKQAELNWDWFSGEHGDNFMPQISAMFSQVW